MPTENKYEQLYTETGDWIQKLNRLKEENIYLKERLAHIVSRETGSSILMKAEALQHRLLNKDSTIRFLRKEIKDYAANLAQRQPAAIADDKTLLFHGKIRSDVKELENQLNILRSNFDSYFEG